MIAKINYKCKFIKRKIESMKKKIQLVNQYQYDFPFVYEFTT